MNKSEILINRVTELSVSDFWETAKQEWELFEIYFVDEPKTCLCSHYPIKEVCVIKNKHSHKKSRGR